MSSIFMRLAEIASRFDQSGKHQEADALDRALRQYKEYHEIDPDKAYEQFRDSYMKSTGRAWDRDKFDHRAKGWQFWGDEDGYVAVRPQRNGVVKMTGSAGSIRSIYKAVDALIQSNLPVWGLVSEDIKNMAVKKGLVSPPEWLMRRILPLIPSRYMHQAEESLKQHGKVTIDYADIGSVDKYFVATRAYFQWLATFVERDPSVQEHIPQALARKILAAALRKL